LSLSSGFELANFLASLSSKQAEIAASEAYNTWAPGSTSPPAAMRQQTAEFGFAWTPAVAGLRVSDDSSIDFFLNLTLSYSGLTPFTFCMNR
jgi:hypothetical protein